MKGAQEEVSPENSTPASEQSWRALRLDVASKFWYRIKGGFPAAQSNLSGHCSAQEKKSETWIMEKRVRSVAATTPSTSQSTPTELRWAARNRPSPQAGSNKRSLGLRTTQRTRAL